MSKKTDRIFGLSFTPLTSKFIGKGILFMNNKIIMMIIGAVIVVLLAVMLVWGVSSCSREPVGDGLIDVGGSEVSEESSEVEEDTNIPGVADAPEEWLDEDYEEDTEGNGNKNEPSHDGSSENKGEEESSSASSSSKIETVSQPSGNGSSASSSAPSSGSSSSSSDTSSKPTVEDAEDDGEVTYEEYIAMSGAEQQKYLESFDSIEAFFAWYNAAKEKYDKENPSIEIGDGSINMEDIIGGGNP